MDLKKAQPLITHLLEKFFQHLYHSLAWGYDMVAAAVSLGRWNKWIQTIYPMIDKGRILELGFGPGHLQVDLTKHGQNIIGIDESPQMCRLAQKRLMRNRLSGNLSRANAQAMPFPSGYFDIVVATFPSPFIFQGETLYEIFRVLRKDGKVVVLLAAQPMGKSIGDRIIHSLFKITSEAPPTEESYTKFEQHGLKYGLRLTHQWLNFNADRLLLITGTREEQTNGESN